MPEATNLQTSFLGGELSQSYQGRYDKPDYKTSLAVCLNMFPIETGALTRRGGTQFLGTTLAGQPGKLISFDIKQAAPILLEFTSGTGVGYLRFFSSNANGPYLVTTNDAVSVLAISNANPAVVQTATPTNWATGFYVRFSNLGVNNPVLQNRDFRITTIDSTHFSIQDGITFATIDGSTIGAFVSGKVAKGLLITTPYASGLGNLRSVQAETQAVLLNGMHPQVLSMTAAPTPSSNATFSFLPSNFIDGPYLDPFPGSICTYDVLVGNVTLTFTFQAYSASVSYNIGDYVLSGGNGYRSLVNANLNNTPPNASFWQPVPGGAPVGPSGFIASDIGRHIRLFSEPPPWAVGTAYVATNVVKYNGAYYQAVTTSTGVPPAQDATKWAVVTGATYAQWTWGRILSVSGAGLINPSIAIGNYTSLSAAFDGTVSKNAAASANSSASATTYPVWVDNTPYSSGQSVYYSGNLYTCANSFTVWTTNTLYQAHVFVEDAGGYFESIQIVSSNIPPHIDTGHWVYSGAAVPSNGAVWTFAGSAASVSLDLYAGQDFHTSPKQITYAVVFPSSDLGFAINFLSGVTCNLRAKHSVPGSASDGTLLGSTGVIGNTISAFAIGSGDTATSWEYVWIEVVGTVTPPLPDNGSHTFTISAFLAQVQFFAPNVANGSVVTIQLAGPPLLYVAGTVVNTWRAGAYSDSNGWPTNGTYSDSRLWLAGAIGNRFDASNSNQIFNFAPTAPDGTVAASNAITYTFNAPDVNQIVWMSPDLQGIIAGTQGGEWLIQPATASLPLGPNNIQAHRVTKAKCANIEPRRTEHTLVAVQARARKIFEYFADVFSGKFSAPNLMEKARHLTAAQIQEIGYQQELTPTIWARMGDGSWIGGTYKRDTLMTSQGPTFIGWHRHQLGSRRVVESIAVGPSQTGTLDALSMITNDPATGVRHVELLTDYQEETEALTAAWLLDDAVVPTSTTTSNVTPAPYGGLTLNGLWHLNGKTVQVFAGGLDCGLGENGLITDFVVSNGSVVVPYGDGVSAGSGAGLFTAAFVNSFLPVGIPIVVGFTFTSQGQRTRPIEPPETGARNGPALGKKRRNHKYAIQLVNTTGLSVGTDFGHIDIAPPETDTTEKLPLGQLFSGVHRDAIDDAYSFDGQICWQITRPWPAMITAISGLIATQDE